MIRVVQSLSFARYYVGERAAGPYYEVMDDGNTESVHFVHPDDSTQYKTLRRAWSADDRRSIDELILDDMKQSGLEAPDRLPC